MQGNIPILVKTWAGSERYEMRYIRRSLPSLLRSALPDGVRVIIVDDCSPNPKLQPFLESLARAHSNVELWRNENNLGPNKGQEVLVPKVWEQFPDAPFIVCCDDDVIYHPGWLQRLIQVRREANDHKVDGIFTAINTPMRAAYRVLELPTSKVYLKQRQFALNWLIPRVIYDRIGPFRDCGVAYDTDYVNRMERLEIPVVCLGPSWVQNIGYSGAYQKDDTYKAYDYVGSLDAFLRFRELWYGFRRHLINAGLRIPHGRAKRLVKWFAKPIRRVLDI